MRSSEGEWKLVQFDGDYIESYFEDNSCLTWNKESLTYSTLKGNRIQLHIESVHQNDDLSSKLARIVQKENRYNDNYIELPSQLQKWSKPKQKFKKYKIVTFNWEQSYVRIDEQACYEIVSEDMNAKVILQKNLYRVRIVYLQRTTGRRVSEQSVYMSSKNQRKMLLEKYNYKYVEYPVNYDVGTEMEYEYHEVEKEFTIYNLPERWYPPMRYIWGYILANDLVPHPFCYIDFEDPDMKEFDRITETKMPPYEELLTKMGKQSQTPNSNSVPLPIYGKPNHNHQYKWSYIQKKGFMIVAHALAEGNIFCENNGFWFIEGSTVGFRGKNKNQYDYQVNINAFPLTVRIEGQPFRDIRNHIYAFFSYLQHKHYIVQKNRSQKTVKKLGKDDEIIFEEEVEDIGNFKAYGNGMVVARFTDKIMMTMKQEEVRVIALNGKSYFINLNGSQSLVQEYKWYLDYLKDVYQRVYFPEEWKARMALNEEIEERLRSTEAFLHVSQRFKSDQI